MRKFRLSSDILSPIHSDISLNDSSVFSHGSISSTPGFMKEVESSKSGCHEKDSTIDTICKTNLKETASAFDVIVNDIKKNSNINAEKEERFKESYKTLKHSMDELYNRVHVPSVLSPLSSDINFEFKNCTPEKTPDKRIPKGISEMPKNVKDYEKNQSTKPKTVSQISSKTSTIKEQSKLKKKDNIQKSNVSLPGESTVKDRHCKNKKEIGVQESNSVCGLQKLKTSKTVSSYTQTCENFEETSVKPKSEETSEHVKENLKTFYTKKQRKLSVSNPVSDTENKGVSIIPSIQVAISMELDNLRGLMLEQNLNLRKDLLKFEETVKKQKATTAYLFSVIDKLMEENMKLISNRNKI